MALAYKIRQLYMLAQEGEITKEEIKEHLATKTPTKEDVEDFLLSILEKNQQTDTDDEDEY